MSSADLLVNVFMPAVLTGVTWWLPSLTGPTLPFGVRSPDARADAPEIAVQRRQYRQQVAASGAVLIMVGVLVSSVFRFGMPGVIPLLTVAAYLAAYGRARVAVMAVKRREDWYGGLRQGVVADTALRTDPERFPWMWAVPALLICIGTTVVGVLRYPSLPDRIPVHFTGSGSADRFAARSISSAFFPVFAQAALTVLLLALTWLSFRARADLDPARPADSARRHRRFSVRTAISLLLLAAFANLSLLAGAWAMWHAGQRVSPALIVLPILAGLVVVICIAVRTGQGASRLPTHDGAVAEESTGMVRRDDDQYWRLLGSVYVNRADPALLVQKRFGIGWTVNFGNPRGVVLLLGLILAPALVVPLLVH
ncbi:DUF5808 domain-containing protein [Streptomyces sp. NBC_01728]|uniref:DUF1648 domain-containing protein n=1 Tax=unclassified Streptomyces TaxID=2593676 RepID=UPI002250429A|nr:MULTISPECIES: DUF5808 domain-containing protein [unclassified Streptomyces]MCX4461383.1 DUF5808 domain-containing protein [Streptomyces sp. NBC_01719]MCX4490291.1 DUF5808 domain-containing protein [Streptomyces sp. NBC_01728]MCX4597085.1 DUF5808 domain-containing protein [Streptomyces sp. NBC_01549]